MRSHIALFIAILVSLLCALLGSLISQQIRQTPRRRLDNLHRLQAPHAPRETRRLADG
tara:strand:+ start:19031 stop:19204 length:174 start_codon:yes stop_codon:yes gene_type:complete